MKRYYNLQTEQNEEVKSPGLLVISSDFHGNTHSVAYGFINKNNQEIMRSVYGGNMGHSTAVFNAKMVLDQN